MATWIMTDPWTCLNVDLVPSITFAVSDDCHISATVQPPLGDQREPVVLHDEAAWNLREYLSHADVPVYLGEQAWEQWKREQAWAQRRAQQS